MRLEIKRLGPELTEDYLDFFNNRAFTDNPPWGGCYCIGWQMGREAQDRQDRAVAQSDGGEAAIMAILAEEVRAQIASGALRGYLAYADGLCIGWCNANDRANLQMCIRDSPPAGRGSASQSPRPGPGPGPAGRRAPPATRSRNPKSR